MSKQILAIIYDFDKTLAETDMQNYDFIPKLNMSIPEFWNETEIIRKKYDMDKILSYMYTMLVECKKRDIVLSREYLNNCANNITYYPGVNSWFDRINQYGKDNGIIVEHYIISSGNLEILEKCSIAKKFKKLFACEFIYNEKGEAVWPKTIVNYTLKTQSIYRIQKGLTKNNDDTKINMKTPKKRIPFSNMIYIGDGSTDVPSMIMVKENGGTSIAVYPKDHREKVNNLFEEDRVNYICKADYSKDSEIESIVKLLIDTVKIKSTLEKKIKKDRKKNDYSNTFISR